MFAFTVTATAIGLPSWNTSVPSGGGTVTTTIGGTVTGGTVTIFGGGGTVTGGSGSGVVVVVKGGTVVVVVGVGVGVDGVAGVDGVDGVVVVGVVVVGVVGVAGAGAGTAVCTETGFEICVARGGAVAFVRDRTTAGWSRTEARAFRATWCGTATAFAWVVATTTCAPLGAGVASSRPTASMAPT